MSSVGFIKLHRRLKDSDVFADSELFHIFSFCLLEAAWEPIDKPVGNKVVSLKVGQFITGRKKISRITGVKESKIYRCLNTLERLNIIEQQKTTKYSIISIVNWSKYQHAEQQTNNKSTTNEQQKNTVKEVKKKEDKNNRFEEFWDVWPKKKSKEAAVKAWNKLNNEERQLAIDAIPKHLLQDQWQKKQYIPLPATWLNGKQWQDEVEAACGGNTMSPEALEIKCKATAAKLFKSRSEPGSSSHPLVHKFYQELVDA